MRGMVRGVTHVITSAREALDVAAEFAASLAENVIARDRAGAVPREELAALDRSGLIGITVPREHGGAGVPPSVLAEVIRRIAAVDPAIAQAPQGHFMVIDILRLLGTPTQQSRLFAEVLAGGRLGPVLAERGAQHAQMLGTRIVPADDEGWAVSGRKYYTTGAITSRWLAVSAVDPDERVVLAFIPRDDPSVQIDEDWNVMGQRATVSGTTVIEDGRVDRELWLEYWRAYESPQLLGARAQIVHAAIEVGIAGGALADARAFVRDKARPFFEAVNSGWAQRAAEDPHTIFRFGRLATQVRAAEQLLRWAGEELDEIGLHPADADAAARGSLAVAQAKAFGSEVSVLVASDLFALAGASAADERHDLSRHWRNARTHSVHDPVDWKYHHLGAYLLNNTIPPNHGQL